MYIHTNVKEMPILALLDSGSSHTVADSGLFDILQEMGHFLRPVVLTGKAANNTKINIVGIVKVNLQIGSKIWKGDVLLVKNLSHSLIVGAETIKALGGIIDFKHGKIQIEDEHGTEILDLYQVNQVGETKQNECNESRYRPEISVIELPNGKVVGLKDDLDESESKMFEEAEPLWWDPENVTHEKPLELTHPGINEDQKMQVNDFVARWKREFESSPGKCNQTVAKIYMDPNTPPTKDRVIRLSPKEQSLAQDQIQKLLKEGIIEEATGDWCSAAFCVKKPGEPDERRLVVNFSTINKNCKNVAAPLPRTDDVLNHIQGAFYLTKLDLISGFHQIVLDESSKDLTGFNIAGGGFYRYTRLPQGLKISSSIFQMTMEKILRPVLFKCAFVYIDDICVYSQTFEQHLKDLETVMKLIRESDMRINFKKSKFCLNTIDFLGFEVGSNQVKVSQSKVGAILRYKRPRNVKDVRRFLGLVGWYRKFIKNMAEHAAPLNLLLQKDQNFNWGEEQERSFEYLKSCLISPEILAIPDPQGQYRIEVDACDSGIGGVIYLESNDKSKANVVGFCSRSLTKREKNLTTTEKEILGVLYCLQTWHHLILGSPHPTIIVTDHSAIVWLFSIPEPKGRIFRYIVKMNQYPLKVIHKAGKFHTVPDAISRATENSDEESESENEESENENEENHTVDVSEVQVTLENLDLPDFTTTQDPWIKDMMIKVATERDKYPHFKVVLPYLYKKVRDPEMKQDEYKVVVPSDMRQQLIQNFHESEFGGHGGINKTYKGLLKNFYFPKMFQEIRKFVRGCKECQRHKVPGTQPAGKMTVKDRQLRPHQLVSIDLVGPLVTSRSQNKFILTILDEQSKYLIAKPMRSATSENVIKILKSQLIYVFGVPEIILSDSGSQFTSATFENFCKSFGIKHNTVPVHYPRGNPVERVHRTIKAQISIFIKGQQKTWDEHLDHVVFAYNTAIHESTGFAPSTLVFGQSPRTPFDVENTATRGNASPADPTDYVSHLKKKIERCHLMAKNAVKKAKESNAKRFNLRRSDQKFNEGDLVWRKSFLLSDKAAGFSKALAPKYLGPSKIIKKLSDNQFILADLDGKYSGKWAAENIKPYFDYT